MRLVDRSASRKIKDIPEFKRRVESGADIFELAELYGCSVGTVQRYMKLHLPSAPKKTKSSLYGLSDEQIRRVHEMRSEGYLIREIADVYGIPKQQLGTLIQATVDSHTEWGKHIDGIQHIGLQVIKEQHIPLDMPFVITKNRHPTWVSIPVEEYARLKNEAEQNNTRRLRVIESDSHAEESDSGELWRRGDQYATG